MPVIVSPLKELVDYVFKTHPTYKSCFVIKFKDPKYKDRFKVAVLASFLRDFQHLSPAVDQVVFVPNDFNTTCPATGKIDTKYIRFSTTKAKVDFQASTFYAPVKPIEHTPHTPHTPYVAPEFKDKYTYKKVSSGKDMPELLYNLLVHKTPHGHEGDVHIHIKNELRRLRLPHATDKFGNLITEIRGKDAENREILNTTMFSCHTDTVHNAAGKIDLYRTTGPTDVDTDFIFAMEDGKASVLGADDKVGVFIMLQMLEANIPGLYIFHVGEEKGCLGSKDIVKNRPSVVTGIKRCIAFDRKGYTDVIDRQRGICCSDEFAKDLASKLNTSMETILGVDLGKAYTYEPETGVYTDSAEYVNIIPECTNLSVGYFDQHTRGEHFDIFWLTEWFIPALKLMDWSSLVTERDPTPKPVSYITHNNNNDTHNRYGTDMPTNLKNIKFWIPTMGMPSDTYEMDRRDKVRKWLYTYNYKAATELLEAMETMKQDKEALELTCDIMTDVYSTFATLTEGVKNCKLKADYEALIKETATNLSAIVCDIFDIATTESFSGLTIEGISEEIVEEEEEDDTPIPLGEQEWRETSYMFPYILRPVYPLPSLDISFNVLFNRVYVEDKTVAMYSKKGKQLKTKHLNKLSDGTEIHIDLDGVRTHVYTIDIELAADIRDAEILGTQFMQ